MPVHPDLGAVFSTTLTYGSVSEGDVHRTTVWSWMQKGIERVEHLGA